MAQDIDAKTKVELYAVLVAIPVVATWLWYMGSVSHSVASAEIVNARQDAAIGENRVLINRHRDELLNNLFEIKGAVIEIRTILKQNQREK